MTELSSLISRREFISRALKYAAAAGSFSLGFFCPFRVGYLNIGGPRGASALDKTDEIVRQSSRARYWVSTAAAGADCLCCHKPTDRVRGKKYIHETNIVKCLLCAQGCIIKAGERGRCRVRMNIDGELRSLVYGRPIAIHIDPIEKKPFYHFLPGSAAYSLATSGCPLRCKFCQNWQLSQSWPEDYQADYTPPRDIVGEAVSQSAPVIAFTYNEPTVFTEYMTDIAREARKQNIRSVLISCGIMNEAPLSEICDLLDAIKIDLKGYSEDFYRKVCGAELQPVLRSIKQISRRGVHLEIVNLVVPTLNDSDNMFRSLVEWVAGEAGPDVPIHFTRFHPDYQLLNLPPTPLATLERVREIAMVRGLHYAYVGNVPDHPGNHTYCPSCGKVVVKRNGFFIMEMNVREGRCAFCRKKIAGVWT